MVEVVVVSSTPEWNEMAQRDREVVARVSINGLEKTQHNPNVAGKRVM